MCKVGWGCVASLQLLVRCSQRCSCSLLHVTVSTVVSVGVAVLSLLVDQDALPVIAPSSAGLCGSCNSSSVWVLG